ncbi:glycosyltransferase family 4 protein [Modestobacter muralis]|uniref:Glycosyltransferase family 4 protein n=1 Tax=Modestobacter muralis TaxID=1608614 RepID=A0A6P0ESX7_9ACTN|nr:glycosyltransferase family 4 protein [Modestobacter muralis]NEN51739.1 glycosyltransferase family 4 protein [Modestobacter muralis]
MRRTVLVAHPSADLYGSDLQLVESVGGLTAAGWEVVVALPGDGPLRARLEAAGAAVELLPVPVLRKSLLRPAGLLGLVVDTSRALPVMVRRLRSLDPAVVYVNTVTVPLWLVAARLAGRPALCHVHEAEDDAPRLVGVLLNAPLLLARTVVVNSNAAAATLLRAVPALRRRTEVVHNGVAGPPEPLPPVTAPTGPRRVVLVGRLAPRKGTDVALEAAGLLRAEGRDVVLQLCGTVFPGYEWFEEQLRERAARPDLAGAVEFAGYTSPTWPALAQADVVLVPSRAEPFGNTAVEAQLAGRPVVVSAVQGLREIVTDGETGLLVTPGDPADLARAVGSLLDDAGLARSLAAAGRESALRRFSRQRYQDAVTAVVERTAR